MHFGVTETYIYHIISGKSFPQLHEKYFPKEVTTKGEQNG